MFSTQRWPSLSFREALCDPTWAKPARYVSVLALTTWPTSQRWQSNAEIKSNSLQVTPITGKYMTTYLAVVPHKHHPVPGVHGPRAEITFFNAHFRSTRAACEADKNKTGPPLLRSYCYRAAEAAVQHIPPPGGRLWHMRKRQKESSFTIYTKWIFVLFYSLIWFIAALI